MNLFSLKKKRADNVNVSRNVKKSERKIKRGEEILKILLTKCAF